MSLLFRKIKQHSLVRFQKQIFRHEFGKTLEHLQLEVNNSFELYIFDFKEAIATLPKIKATFTFMFLFIVTTEKVFSVFF